MSVLEQDGLDLESERGVFLLLSVHRLLLSSLSLLDVHQVALQLLHLCLVVVFGLLHFLGGVLVVLQLLGQLFLVVAHLVGLLDESILQRFDVVVLFVVVSLEC